MAYLDIRFINNIIKEYPDMFKIVVFKQPHVFIKSSSVKRNKFEVTDDYCPSVSSLKRTKQLVRDITLCNDFELFCTFTFDPKLVNSFNFYKCWRKMSTWLHHQSDNSREKGIKFKYLIIPEMHKSGRWHFHALISGYTSTLKPTRAFTTSSRPIFNITSFRSGFTTAVRVDSKEAVASYVTKYITKDFIKTFNQRRFFCSRNLIRPVSETNGDIRFVLPIFKRNYNENSDSYEYIVDKDNLFC